MFSPFSFWAKSKEQGPRVNVLQLQAFVLARRSCRSNLWMSEVQISPRKWESVMKGVVRPLKVSIRARHRYSHFPENSPARKVTQLSPTWTWYLPSLQSRTAGEASYTQTMHELRWQLWKKMLSENTQIRHRENRSIPHSVIVNSLLLVKLRPADSIFSILIWDHRRSVGWRLSKIKSRYQPNPTTIML